MQRDLQSDQSNIQVDYMDASRPLCIIKAMLLTRIKNF